MTDLFDTASRVATAERFLNMLFGNLCGDRYGYLWTIQDKATYPYRVSDAAQRKAMAQRAIELSDSGKDVYVGINVGDEPAAQDKRYTKEQITVQTATVTDIDVEGGNHISDAAQFYPPNGVVAKTFLPFAASLVVDSGYGVHGYCLYAEPIDITADNRDACIARNKRYIDAVRARAGVFSKAVDGVHDLPRVLRCPGTFNYKAGKNGAPLCKLVEVNDIRFTPTDIDNKLQNADLNATIGTVEKPNSQGRHFEPRKEFLSMGNDNKNFSDSKVPNDHQTTTKSPPTPDKADKADYLSTAVTAKIIGVTKQTVENWRKKGWLAADLIDHKGVFYYTVERVMQLKSVYHSKWTHGSYQPASDEPSEQDRARAMLAFIPLKDLRENEWLAAVSALKNLGFSYGEVDALNQGGENYNERENQTRWDSLTDPSFDIATLHGIAKNYGYSEKDFRREWYNLRGIKTARRPKDDEPARADVDGSGRDDLIDSLFSGDGSDLAFARRLEAFCGDRVKWCNEASRWYTYKNGVWTAGGSENSTISHFAADLAELMQQRAANDAEHKLADKFQSSKKIGSAINLLKARHSVRITLDDLDQHPELLNVLNGVVDLQTGELREAAPELLLTRQCRADFDPRASAPLVEEFFKAIQPDDATRAGLLRWLAYGLTGETREERFAVWTGSGGNGKGVLGGTLLELLGTYATGLAPRALLKNNRPADANAATTSLNALEGVRFAISEELPLDAELDSSLVKNLTGGDRINLRRNFGEYRTVVNFAKINISGNYLPRLENVNDTGIRRRLLNFAFDVRFGTAARPADPLLKKKLLQPKNLRGLLSLLVREAALWYRDGLIISDAMEQATARHLAESDFVADFIDDHYVKIASASVKAKDFIEELRREYPRECSRFKRADLISLVAAQDGISYVDDRKGFKIFKGIGKAAQDEFDGEPIDPRDAPD